MEDTASESNPEYDSSLLGRELGPIIYEMTVHQAFNKGFYPNSKSITTDYPIKARTRTIRKSIRRLQDVTADLREIGHQHGIHDTNIIRRIKPWQTEKTNRIVARQYIALTNERKHLLYNAEVRPQVVIEILKSEFQQTPDTRAILFMKASRV